MPLQYPSRRAFLHSSLLCGGTLALAPTRLFSANPTPLQATTVARGDRGVVATVHPLASQAAIDAFERGGNAIDAAVAASIMLSVVDGHNSGLGGGCLALVRRADGTTIALDGREKAPQAATPEMFFRNGRPAPQLSQTGALAVGVPGLPAALYELSRRHGNLTWHGALNAAAEVAEAGFEITENYASVLRSEAQELKQFPASSAILLDASGNPWKAGDLLRQTDLATSLRALAEFGVDWFYRGEFARRTAEHLREQGGLITQEDFDNYNTVSREAISTIYRDKLVLGFPPPSSGGIHIAQMLGMLGAYDLKQIFVESTATGLHLLLEVMKRALADRAYWLGDADFAQVPRGLLDPTYLRQLASTIDLERSTPVNSHGQPPRADVDLFGQGKHTTHLTTADAEGNVVAITQTVNTSFGSKMIVPGTGIVLNNEMDDFSIAPGVRNAFGLVGSQANAVAAGKRPLSSMSPTIVLNDAGQPILSCGAAGGPKIITTTLQVLVRVLDLGQSIDEAIAAPRLHHQWSPDKAVCENAVSAELVAELARRGHSIEQIKRAAVSQGLARLESGAMIAASDPRVPSSALAF